ncbi:MAG: ribonuclease H-like domain-containing protein [Anaerolineae bacterium]|nr:ribonuclease H-like domain-containing protein [Anaerolineae bacterium]
MSERLLVFDLETQYLADEVGGWNHIRDMRLSVGVTYSPLEDLYRVYTERDVERLISDLSAANWVVGYNLLRFDYEVLHAYTDRRLSDLPTVDMLVDLHQALGWRPKLDDVAAATLGERKSGDGLDAVRWFREGKIDEVIAYCKRDVQVTWRVYDFGRQNGYVQIMGRSWRPRMVTVPW